MAPNPAQNLQAVQAGHSQVEQDQCGQWKFASVRKRRIAAKISHTGGAAPDRDYRVEDAGAFQRPAHEENVILIVIHNQDWSEFW